MEEQEGALSMLLPLHVAKRKGSEGLPLHWPFDIAVSKGQDNVFCLLLTFHIATWKGRKISEQSHFYILSD